MSEFKVGDKVYCATTERHGVIVSCNGSECSFPIEVNTGRAEPDFYTNDGRFYGSFSPVTLSHVQEENSESHNVNHLYSDTITTNGNGILETGSLTEDKTNPDHYTKGGIECINYLQAKLSAEEFKGFLKGNIIKYTTRAEHKNGVEDYRKAKWYMDKLDEFCGK